MSFNEPKPKIQKTGKGKSKHNAKQTEDRPEKPHGTNGERREHTGTEGTGMGHAGTKTDEPTEGEGTNTGLKTDNNRGEGGEVEGHWEEERWEHR